MLQMVRLIVIIMSFAAIIGCKQIDIQGADKKANDRVQARFEYSKEVSENLYAGSIMTSDSYVFYTAADPHINKTIKNLSLFNDAFRNDKKASFGVVLGDCTDVRDNLPKYLDALAYSPDRHLYNYSVYHVLGNHDTYTNGWWSYKEYIGASVYWFETVFPQGKDLYITLDTATGSLGSKQTKWFKEFLSKNRSNYRHCTILTHTNFFYTDNSQTGSGNMPIEETFALIDFLGKHNVSLVLQGHDHYREDLTFDNVRYVILGTIRDESKAPEYLIVEASPSGIKLDWQLI